MSEPLSNEQQARLKKLQDGYQQAPSTLANELVASDLLLLLRQDPILRSLIGEISHASQHPPQGVRAVAAPLPDVVSPLPAPVLADTLRNELQAPLDLLAVLQRHPEVMSAWGFSPDGSEGLRLMSVVACAANWDRIERLWDVLAQRCKQERRLGSEDEYLMLTACLDIYNLILTGRQAELMQVATGSAYDYRTQERGGGGGQTVAAVWLPGLKNGGGVLRKKPLVETQ